MRELDEAVQRYSVYARVQPEHKVRIVNSVETAGPRGRYDGGRQRLAPSIKAADIGIGMGITGTDVTKNVADMILADDNFATIERCGGRPQDLCQHPQGDPVPALVQPERGVGHLLCHNAGLYPAAARTHPVDQPDYRQLPALALGMETGSGDAMRKPPRDSRESFRWRRGRGYRLSGGCWSPC